MKKRLLQLLLVCTFIISLINTFSQSAVCSTNLDIFAGETPSGVPLNKMEETIDQHLSKYIGKTAPGAAVGVIKDGEIIFLKGYGYADVDNQIAVDPKNTVFEWGSISKLFTWTSVMQLVEQGKIDLDVDIKTYLPIEFFKKLEYKQPVTMKDLMNHAAGFGDYPFNTIVLSPDSLVSLEEAILRDKPKQYYKVGTASSYNNYSTSLAGYIVQNISNQAFEAYEKEHIFNILSMNNTSAHPTFDDNKKILENKAKGYVLDQKGGFKLGNWSYLSNLPAGSINGTAEDLAKYAIALTPKVGESSPLFRDSDTLDTLFSPSYHSDKNMVGTAHGFFEYIGEYRTLGHGGNTATFSTQFAIVPKERFGVILLTNAKSEMDILFGLHDLLLGKKDDEIKGPNIELPSSSKVAGPYIPMQRPEGTFVEFANYMSLYKIEATGPNKITMNIGGYKGTYLQTKPYYYELVDCNTILFKNVYPILRFKMDDKNLNHIIVGHGMDLSSLPQGRTVPFLIGSVIVLLVNILFFFLAPIILIIFSIKNRNKKLNLENTIFNLYHSILILCGTVTIVNNLIPSAKMIITNFHTFSELKPHILLNYPLLLISLIITIFSTIYMKKAMVSKKRRVMYHITIILLISLFALLLHWNYFAIVG